MYPVPGTPPPADITGVSMAQVRKAEAVRGRVLEDIIELRELSAMRVRAGAPAGDREGLLAAVTACDRLLGIRDARWWIAKEGFHAHTLARDIARRLLAAGAAAA